MGKGNRNRNDRYDSVYDMSTGSGAAVKSAKPAAKKDNTTKWLIATIAALVLVALAIFLFSSSGIVERNTVYVSSDNYEVDGMMIPYYENLAYSNQFNQMLEIYYYMYGDVNSAYNALMQQMSGYTLESFFDAAVTSAKEIVALCEAANAAGVTLDDEDYENIEATIEDLGSPSSLGIGVTKKDVKKAVTLQALASKYAGMISDEIEGGITDDILKSFIDEDKDSYYSADYLKAELSLKAEDFEDDALAYAKAEKIIETYTDAIAKATDVDSFKKLVIGYHIESTFDKTLDKNKGDLATPDEDLRKTAIEALIENTYKVLVKGEAKATAITDNETYKEVFLTLATGYLSTAEDVLKELPQTVKYATVSDDEIAEWASDAATKVGETKSVDESTEDEIVKVICMLSEAMHLDTSATKDFAHILIKAEREEATADQLATAKEKAEKALAEYKAGELTLDAFKKIAETYNEDSGVVYENTTEGQMVTEIDKWIFDAARKAGDIEIIQTQFGYHVTYFIGDGEAPYYTGASADYIDKKYTERLEELSDKYLTVNEKAIAKRGGTIETDTEAAA